MSTELQENPLRNEPSREHLTKERVKPVGTQNKNSLKETHWSGSMVKKNKGKIYLCKIPGSRLKY